MKNPGGYIVWHMANYSKLFDFRLYGVAMFLVAVCMLPTWRRQTQLIQDHDRLLLASGKNIEGTSGRYTGYHNTIPYKTGGNLESMMRADIELN
jgi:hypothetical protein